MEDIQAIATEAQTLIDQATDTQELEAVRLKFLGKKGSLTEQLKQLGQLDPKERPVFGKQVNIYKAQIESQIQARLEVLSQKQLEKSLQENCIDVTLPGRQNQLGGSHLVTATIERIENFFSQLGFSVAQGPEIEDDYHNFEALNIPPHHPARAGQDTFYLKDRPYLLRTQTSGVQIRQMAKSEPPLRMIAPGRVFRSDSDVTHTPMFHQVEGLWVDIEVNMSHLKGVINAFLADFFGKEIRTRFRPSYFPFTEPSAEVDIEHDLCKGKGCRICKQTGWLEVLGCGMVHPNVFKAVNIDPVQYRGFAFGLGVERLAMLRHGVDDLRLFFENRWPFVSQFKGS